jgi:hypothetical protein
VKNQFDWYFTPAKQELDEIWKSGILTVDTNVLLDLYRYHKSTRDSLLSSLQKFEGKKWISRQAAHEFIRNRTKVIVSAGKTFQQAHDETAKLSNNLAATISQLKGNRIIPNELVEELRSAIDDAIKKAQESIGKSKSDYPDFFQEDSILDQLSQIFGGSVGENFKDSEIDSIKTEAEKRKNELIPPGYLDNEKDGDRSYGDYFLWRQILEYAKETQRPIILVTSERKEDWWEIISGRTTGPRPELLKEAKEYSGQRILIYQTERFLQFALQRLKQPINDIAIEEIRAISTLRSAPDIAVKLIEQATTENTQYHNAGVLSLELRRSIKNFTVSGHFGPIMAGIPSIKAKCIRTPPECPPLRIGAGTGTNHDFNIHASVQDGFPPLGIYEFQYDAYCEEPILHNDSEPEPDVVGALTLAWPEVPRDHMN